MNTVNRHAKLFPETDLNKRFFNDYEIDGWEMMGYEKLIFVKLIEELSPRICIEIGSRKGGSLQILNEFAEKTYCLDVDPTLAGRLSHRFAKTIFIAGDSKTTLPTLLEELQNEGNFPDFIHIDGDHSVQGAFHDLDNALSFSPPHDVYILMHDSFNPDVRDGIKLVDFESKKHLTYADLDFCPGVLHVCNIAKNFMWSGFALFKLSKNIRTEELFVNSYLDKMYEAVKSVSVHGLQS